MKKFKEIIKRKTDTLLGVKQVQSKLLSIEQDLKFLKASLGHVKESIRSKNVQSISISDKIIITKIFSGIKMYLDLSDIAVAPHIALDGIWENDMTAAWLSVHNGDQVVFDIGANFGYYGLLSAQRTVNNKPKIYLFEANTNLVPYITQSLSVNGYHQKCKVENLAISNKKGKATLTVLKDFIGCSSLNSLTHLGTYLGGKMPLETSQKLTVPTITIDEYCRANSIDSIDIVKLDIEGLEDKAYDGMKGIIDASPDMIIFLEFTKQGYSNPEVFYDKIISDFQFMYKIESGGRLSLVNDKSYASVIESKASLELIVLSKKKVTQIL